MKRLVDFVARAARNSDWKFTKKSDTTWELVRKDEPPLLFTTDRDFALQDEKLQLIGLEHPVISKMLRQYTESESGFRAIAGKINGINGSGLLTIWKVNVQGKDGQTNLKIVKIGLSKDGSRAPWLERIEDNLLSIK